MNSPKYPDCTDQVQNRHFLLNSRLSAEFCNYLGKNLCTQEKLIDHANSSAPCIRLSVSGRAAPKATPFFRSWTYVPPPMETHSPFLPVYSS